jgi:hypothetical protein
MASVKEPYLVDFLSGLALEPFDAESMDYLKGRARLCDYRPLEKEEFRLIDNRPQI